MTAAGETRAVRWADGVLTDLGTLGGSQSRATDVSTRGQVMGTSTLTDDPSGPGRAVLWDDGRAIDLGALPGSIVSTALDVDDRGQIVGFSVVEGVEHAVVWTVGRSRR